MRVLSYNLEKNKAVGELLALIDEHDLDLLCLQEVDAAALPEELGGMHLVDRTLANRLGLAIFHRSERYTPVRTEAFALKKSLHDRIAKPAHERLAELGPGLPHLMVGDYNYPLFRRGLSRSVGKTGHDLTFSDGRTYTRYKFLRGHFDFATSVGMVISSVETLPQRGSDHLPILVTATYGTPAVIDEASPTATAIQ